MKQAYCEPGFNTPTLPLLGAIVNEVDGFFEGKGLAVNKRQIYYRIRDRLPQIVAESRAVAESQRVLKWYAPGSELYDKVCKVSSDALDCGLIDWNAIIDEGRNPDMPTFWDSGADIVRAAADSFRLDRWKDQATYVEVWTEKLAHVGLVKQATDTPVQLYVPIQMCRGYGSTPALHDAAERFLEHAHQDQVIIYAGDHDASGMDIDRDIADRLAFYGAKGVEVRRVALTLAQARQHKLSPELLKKKLKTEKLVYADTRGQKYVDTFKTEEIWELDALDPAELQRLIRSAVDGYIDRHAWTETEKAEAEVRERLWDCASELEDQP